MHVKDVCNRCRSRSKHLWIVIFLAIFLIVSFRIPLDASESVGTTLTKGASWGGDGQQVTQYTLKVTNSNSFEVKNWRVEISVPSGASIESGWNGSFQIDSSGRLIVTPLEYNSTISSSANIDGIGFQLVTSSPTENSVKVNSASADRSVPTPTPTPTSTPTPKPTPTSTPTPKPTPTSTPTPIPTPKATPTPTSIPTPIVTPSQVTTIAPAEPTVSTSTSAPSASSSPVMVPTTVPSPEAVALPESGDPTVSNPSSSQTSLPKESFPNAAEEGLETDMDGSDSFDTTTTTSKYLGSNDSIDDDDDSGAMGLIDNSGAGSGGGNGIGSLGAATKVSPANDNSWIFFLWLIFLAVAISVYNSINKRREKQEKESLTKIAIVFVSEKFERGIHLLSGVFHRVKPIFVSTFSSLISKINPSSSIALELQSKASEHLKPGVSNSVSEPEDRYSQAQRLRPPKKIDMSTDT